MCRLNRNHNPSADMWFKWLKKEIRPIRYLHRGSANIGVSTQGRLKYLLMHIFLLNARVSIVFLSRYWMM